MPCVVLFVHTGPPSLFLLSVACGPSQPLQEPPVVRGRALDRVGTFERHGEQEHVVAWAGAAGRAPRVLYSLTRPTRSAAMPHMPQGRALGLLVRYTPPPPPRARAVGGVAFPHMPQKTAEFGNKESA